MLHLITKVNDLLAIRNYFSIESESSQLMEAVGFLTTPMYLFSLIRPAAMVQQAQMQTWIYQHTPVLFGLIAAGEVKVYVVDGYNKSVGIKLMNIINGELYHMGLGKEVALKQGKNYWYTKVNRAADIKNYALEKQEEHGADNCICLANDEVNLDQWIFDKFPEYKEYTEKLEQRIAMQYKQSQHDEPDNNSGGDILQ